MSTSAAALSAGGTYGWAVLSQGETYRYELGRRWDARPLLRWVMLNPSTADGNTDDPTIRRCMGFARQLGYGGIVVHNLYALRATHPRALLTDFDPVGPDNLRHLASDGHHCTVAAWGAHPAAANWWNTQPHNVTAALTRTWPLQCLGTTKNGQPRHPLFVKADTVLTPWKER